MFVYVCGHDNKVCAINVLSIVVVIEQGFLLAWAILYKEAWEMNLSRFYDDVKDILSALLPELQPRWLKGMTTVMLTYAIVSIN